MKTLTERARDLTRQAGKFNHPLLPEAARGIILESAKLVEQLAERLEKLEQENGRNE